MIATMNPPVDPTMDFLRALDDSSQWHVVENVPIFAPHTREGQDGKPVVIDEPELYRIASEAMQLERSRGVVPALILGHTKTEKGFDEKLQPDIVGYARHLKVGHFGPERQIGLLATFYFYPDRVREARKFPFRSVEIYPDKGQITKVALLKRDPWLDLGVVHYAQSGQLYYAKEAGAVRVPFFYEGSMPENFDPNMPPVSPADEGLSPEERATADAYARYYAEECENPMMKYMRDQHSQYMASAPSATNTEPPMPDPAAPPVSPGGDDLETVKMQRDQLAMQYQGLKARVDQIERDKNLAEARELVLQLTGEGYKVPADEVNKLAALDAAGRKSRVGEIRMYYQRDPGSGGLINFGEPESTEGATGNVQEGGKDLTKKGMREALAYARANSCSWEQARAQIIQAG